MSQPLGQMHIWMEPPTGFVRIIGRGQAGMTPGFVQVLDRMLSGGCRRIVLDLRECLSMDSTFSGQLSHYALKNPRPSVEETLFVLVGASPSVVEVLDNLFVLELFCMMSPETSTATLPSKETQSVESVQASKEAVSACCLEAHRVLSSLHPSNASRFRDVVKFLEAEHGRHAA